MNGQQLLRVLNDSNFIMQASLGKIDGVSHINKFGMNPQITTASDPEDVWDFEGTYTFSSSANIDSLSSSDAGDSQDIEVIGLDTDWNEVTQTVKLSGQTTVNLTTSLRRVYRMINVDSANISGNVYCYINGAAVTNGVPNNDSDVRAYISGSNNQTLMCIYTIPANTTGLLLGGYFAMNGVGFLTSTIAEMSLKARPFEGIFQVKNKLSIGSEGSSTWEYSYPIPELFSEKTDFKVVCEEVTGTTGVSAGFAFLLFNNSTWGLS